MLLRMTSNSDLGNFFSSSKGHDIYFWYISQRYHVTQILLMGERTHNPKNIMSPPSVGRVIIKCNPWAARLSVFENAYSRPLFGGRLSPMQ